VPNLWCRLQAWFWGSMYLTSVGREKCKRIHKIKFWHWWDMNPCLMQCIWSSAEWWWIWDVSKLFIWLNRTCMRQMEWAKFVCIPWLGTCDRDWWVCPCRCARTRQGSKQELQSNLSSWILDFISCQQSFLYEWHTALIWSCIGSSQLLILTAGLSLLMRNVCLVN
jgi:hypothetical protein